MQPTIDAIIQLNPPGELISALDIAASAGIYYYTDLAIQRLGLDYVVRFSAEPDGSNRIIMTSQEIFVSFSLKALYALMVFSKETRQGIARRYKEISQSLELLTTIQ